MNPSTSTSTDHATARTIRQISLARRLWGFLWRLGLVTLLLFVALEIVLRMLGFGSRERYLSSLDMLWEPAPDQRVYAKYTNRPVTFDAFSLRVVPGVPDDPRRRTILWLGDSVTYGYALSDAEAPPAVLQRELETLQPGRWRVLNAGVSGYNLYLARQRFEKLLARGVRPDLVMLSFCFNEYPDWPSERYSQAELERIVEGVAFKNRMRNVAIYNFLTEQVASRWYYKLRNYLWKKRQPPNPKLLISRGEELEYYRRRIRTCLAAIQARGLPIIGVLWHDKTLKPGTYRPVFVEELQAAGIPVIDVLDTLKGQPAEGLFLEFEHPLAEAVELMVRQAIAPQVAVLAPQLLESPSRATEQSP